MPRLIGKGRALELILDGAKMLNADEARDIGLVNAIFSPEKLIAESIAVAERMTEMGPVACAWVIEAVNHGECVGFREGLALEAERFGDCFGSRDGREGMQAFIERRPPVFKGE